MFCRNFCQRTSPYSQELLRQTLYFALIHWSSWSSVLLFGRNLWKSLCAKGELSDISCYKYDFIHEEMLLWFHYVSNKNIPHKHRKKIRSERKSLCALWCNLQHSKGFLAFPSLLPFGELIKFRLFLKAKKFCGEDLHKMVNWVLLPRVAQET